MSFVRELPRHSLDDLRALDERHAQVDQDDIGALPSEHASWVGKPSPSNPELTAVVLP